MAPSRRPLRVEPLEDRTVPTAMGSPWPDPGTLTVSFAADGTRVGDAASGLSATLAGAGAEVAWQREILRALQSWAVHTNANIALVADGGAAFGTPGEIQGDFRFGDVRVGAVPLSDDSLANASPLDWAIGTWSGDILFNTRSAFAIDPASPTTAADLFTVALHEAGHVFGLEHSDDPRSAVYETYTGPKPGLTAADVAAIQSHYGARQPDRYEGWRGNGTFGRATPVDAVTGAARLTADVQTVTDVDTYSLLNTSLLGTLEVRVKTSGISLLAPKVSVYDMWGRLLAAGTAGPGQDVALTVPKKLLNLGYYVRVTGATDDVFGIGGYEMSVVRADGLVLPPLLTETLTNNTLLGAVPLLGLGTDAGGRERFAAEAALDSKSDVDFYSVTVPRTTDAGQRAMVVTVNNESGRAHPALAVFDAAGRPVDFHVLNNDGPALSVQVLGIGRGQTYFVRVSNPAGADATGRYQLTADFQPPAETMLGMLDAGRLGAARATAGGVLTVDAARLYQFSFASDPAAATGATLTFILRDANGNVVLSLTKWAGEAAVNRSVYLAPGSYTVEVALAAPAGEPVAEVDYSLYLGVESDPVGPYSPGTDSTSYPSSTGYTYPSGSTTTSSSGSSYPTYTYSYQSTSSPPPPQGYYYTY